MNAQPVPRVRMTAAERRKQLLDVTKEIVGEQGFHAVSIEAVARRAGITRPVVYGHFSDLAALLEAMLDREMARALGQLAAVVPDPTTATDPLGALTEALRGYLEVVRADPVTWHLVLMPPEGAPEALRERIGRGRDATVDILAGYVGGAGLPADRRSPDPPLTARTMSAAADEFARLLLTDPDEYPVERLIAHARWLVEQLG